MAEIGIQPGGSLRMWRQALGDAPGLVKTSSRADLEVFARINARYLGGFEIIIDGGSHTAAHMAEPSKQASEKKLKPGGVYLRGDITTKISRQSTKSLMGYTTRRERD